MKTLLIIISLSLFYFIYPHAGATGFQETTDANIFGHVICAQEGEHVPYINVIIEGTRYGAITDASGHYYITNLPVGEQTLVVMGMGYKTSRTTFSIKKGQSLEINLDVDYKGVDLNEIVITSSPTARGFRYQPDNIYLSEELQRRANISFGEMLDGEPGIAMRSMGPTPSRPVIRGLDGDRVLILQNGERMGDISETAAGHAISLDPLASSRVEVVRGPASLLYGSSAIGGVINLMTLDIPERWERGGSGVVSLQGASNNNMGAGFGRYSWGGENWAAGGRFSYRSSGDVYSPEGVIPSTYMDSFDGSVGVGFNNNGVEGGISFSAGKQNYGIPEDLDDIYESAEVRIDQKQLQGRVNFRISDFFDKAQLRMNASSFLQQEVEIEINDNMPEEEIEIEFNKFNISSTLTIQHKPVGVMDRGAIGMNLYSRTMDISGDDAFTPNEKRYNLGLFTFQEIPVNPRVRLQFGGRLDIVSISALPNDFSDMDEGRNAMVYSGSAGLNYRPAPNIEIGGQFARSHRYPMLEELFAHGPHLCAGLYEIGDLDIGDEIGYGSDIFARWSNGAVDAELALFYNYFTNFIIMQPTGDTDSDSGLPVVKYQGDMAELFGGEAALAFSLTDQLKTDLGIDYVIGNRTGGDVNESLPFMPPFRFSARVEYDYGKGWAGARLRAVSSQNRVAPGEESTSGYSLVQLNAGYRLNSAGNHMIILRVDNLFDTSYRDHLTRIEERNFPMPGRNFNLSYRWFF